MISKEFLGFLSIGGALIGQSAYLWSIYKGRTRPHIFSWMIWGIIMGIVFAAQLFKGAGPGAWVTGYSAVYQFVIVILAFNRGEKNITKSDWLAFAGAAAIIPVWYLTKDPLWAVIWGTIIDVLGYYPTFRKSYLKPYEESCSIYAMDTLKWIPALFALESYSTVTMFYPICIVTANTLFVVMILWRRHVFDALPKSN